MVKVEETIQRLREKADHPATPASEADTCRRMAAKLEIKHAIPANATRDRVREDAFGDAGRIANARSHAVGQAFREYGVDFDPTRWAQSYDRAVQAQRNSKIKFDPYLAFEHTRNQYDADRETDIRQERDEEEAADRLTAMSDLDLGGELSRLAHTLLELQTKVADVKDSSARSFLFTRLAARDAQKMQARVERQYQVTMKRFRQIEGELERRANPQAEAEPAPPAEEPIQYRFMANPSPA